MRHRRLRAGMVALMVTVLAGGSAAGQEGGPSPSTVGLWVSLTTTEELPANDWDQATLGRILAAESTTATVETSKAGETVETLIPTREIVVAADIIVAGDTITEEMVALRTVVVDETHAYAYVDTGDAVGEVAAIDILPHQPISPNLLGSGTSAVGSDDELHGYDLLVSEKLAGTSGTLGVTLDQFVERWNKTAADWPGLRMQNGPIVDKLDWGGREFVHWFQRSDAEVGVLGFIKDGEVTTVEFIWLPGLDVSDFGVRDAERALRAFMRSTDPDLTQSGVDQLLDDLGWISGLRSYLDVENQVGVNGLIYTLASYEHEGDEHVTVIARRDDTAVAP